MESSSSPAPSLPTSPSGRLIGKRTAIEFDDTLAMTTEQNEERALAVMAAAQPGEAPDKIESLGQYEIVGEIARGGMGVVFKGYHPELKRTVAIKLLRTDMASADSMERFTREARATATLSRHPGIVSIHDVGSDETGRPFLVMDFVEGQDLRQLLLREGPLPAARVAELLAKICRAVGHAHHHGILHRDLKPHNVMIDGRTGEPMLTDFGLAKTVGRGGAGETSRIRLGARPPSGPVDLTQAGEIIGTPLYMAPEQINPSRGEVSKRTDVFSLGVMLYECLTGRVPFDGESVVNIFDAILSKRPTPPRQLRDSVPSDLQAIAMRALEKSPLARYRTATEMAKDLERFLQKKPVLGVTHRAPAQRASLVRPLALTAILVGVIALAQFSPPQLRLRAKNAMQAFLSDPTPPEASSQDGAPAPPPVTPRSLREQAEAGNPKAMLALGLEILTKRSQPAERGIEWIERAATAGQSSAARTLAKVYAQGIGVAVDRSKAKAWSREALASGDSAARPILINLLLGDGDDASLREAAALLEVIAATGSVSALLTLGDLHGLGERGPWTNPLRALEAWRLAADGGSSKAMMRLGWAFETGQLGLTPKTETALDWYRGAAANGHEPAKASLARLELERG